MVVFVTLGFMLYAFCQTVKVFKTRPINMVNFLFEKEWVVSMCA